MNLVPVVLLTVLVVVRRGRCVEWLVDSAVLPMVVVVMVEVHGVHGALWQYRVVC